MEREREREMDERGEEIERLEWCGFEAVDVTGLAAFINCVWKSTSMHVEVCVCVCVCVSVHPCLQ